MSGEELLFDIIRITLPAALVLAAVYFLIRSFFDNENKRRTYELRMNNQRISLPIRLQAYERITLLLERLSLNNLIFRVKKSGMSAADLQVALLAEVRAEYEHNMSQQVYVSNDAWELAVNAKEEIVKMINLSYSMLPSNASALDLSKQIFETVMKIEHQPTYKAITYLKMEAQELM